MHKQAQSLDEVFDVVDAHDNVIGQSTRGVVHAEGLTHRAVHIFLWNEQGEVFLQKRSAYKDHYPLCWSSSAAGHLDSGEGYHAAALREVEEELGVSVTSLKRLGKVSACAETEQEFVEVYELLHNGPFHLNSAEIAEGGWFSKEEVTAWITREPEAFARSCRKIWRDIYET